MILMAQFGRTRMPTQGPRQQLIVIGAGVIGLQSAIGLLEAGYGVSVVAKHLPGEESIEYTSPWAGAHWRPHGTKEDKEQCQWDLDSYNEWMRLYRDELAQGVPEDQRCGILPTRSRMLWDSLGHEELRPRGDPADLWFAEHVQHYKPIPPPAGCAAAAGFTALTVSVPRFLRYLVRRIEVLGGRIVRAELPLDKGLDAALDAARQAATVATPVAYINATGIAARKLCNDEAVHPARGQTLLIKGVAHGCVTRQGQDYIAYCIPRATDGVTIIGGTKQADRWDGGEDTQDTEQILWRARDLCPELLHPFKDRAAGTFEVLKVNVGLRPMRKGGARMELQRLGSGNSVVHAYGHGGAGFQNSYGVSRKVVEMIQEACTAGHKAKL